MLHYTPPQLSDMNSNTLSPFTKAKRFSTSQDKQPMPPTPDGETVANPKRSSRLNEFMSRSRTASLPPRPHTSSGSTSRQKLSARLGGLKGKGKEKAEFLSPDADGNADGEFVIAAASSSMTSVTDPFAARPSAAAAASFVTYSPVISSPPPTLTHLSTNGLTSRKSVRRPRTAQSIATTTSPSMSFADLPSPPMSPILASPTTPQPSSPPTRRRGSILGAASDALSTFARKTPNMKPRLGGLGRQQSTKAVGLGIHAPQPIVLTEVIEISESAVRASKLREEEEAERQRLRDAAAKAIGIGDIDADDASVNSRTRLGIQDPAEDNHSEHEGGREVEDGWFETKTSGALRSEMSHSRTRSGSFLLPLSQPSYLQPQGSRPSTPTVTSHLGITPPSSLLSTSAPRSPLLPPSPPPRNPSAKSLSSPPMLSVNTATALVPVRRISRTQLRDPTTPMGDRALPPPKIPPFPSTHSSLQPFVQRSGTVPRYYPAPSLLMFALSKQWKNRFLVLTAPLPSPSAQNTPTFASSWGAPPKLESPTPAPSYLHVFKNSGSEERELERLEINEDSVVYMADTEVGGRGNVIKVGGLPRRKAQNLPNPRPATADAMASRTSSSSMEEGSMENGSVASSATNWSDGSMTSDGRAMWALQILDSDEMQAWIAAIKGAVLSQRSIRAGLGTGSNTGGLEPRGDLDVILSMRALHSPISPRTDGQNGIANGITTRLEGNISPTHSQFTDASRSSPTSSLSRSLSMGTTATGAGLTTDAASGLNASNSGTLTPPPRPSMSATTAIKSLFTIGGRPRSPSSASTTGVPVVSPPAADMDTEMYPEDSFTHAGTSLLGMLPHPNGYAPDRPISPAFSGPVTPRAGTPVISTDTHPMYLERKILPDSDRQLVENEGISTPVIDIHGRAGSSIAPSRDNVLVIPQRGSADGMASPSLQPPPRKRAGTVSTVALSISSPSESESYTYTHANRSTAESLGVQNPHLLAPSPPMPATHSPSSVNSARMKDRRARTSWSSVSTYGSNDHTPSSPDDTRSRRWSRRSSMPQRMSPPYPPPGSPPSSPKLHNLRMPAARHPYAADNSPLTRSPSVASNQSYVSDMYSRPSYSTKRASMSSVQSYSTTGASPPTLGSALPKFGSRPRSSHRASMPPPQRPAPNSALPPTPGEHGQLFVPLEETHSAPPTKSSFRESLKLRGKRHSATPPSQPPPSGSLPPRPDEPAFRPTHRRSSSYGSASGTPLAPISTNTTLSHPAFPPPSGPLPPTPGSVAAPSSSPSRHSSITRRFRRISSPATTNTSHSEPASPDPYVSSFLPSMLSPPSPIPETPVHAMPIGEPITTAQNDPNFLYLSPPTPPGSDFSVDAKDLDVQGPTALSPPPRRASRQAPAPVPDEVHSDAETRTQESGYVTTNEEPRPEADPAIVRPPPEIDDFAPTGVAM